MTTRLHGKHYNGKIQQRQNAERIREKRQTKIKAHHRIVRLIRLRIARAKAAKAKARGTA